MCMYRERMVSVCTLLASGAFALAERNGGTVWGVKQVEHGTGDVPERGFCSLCLSL